MYLIQTNPQSQCSGPNIMTLGSDGAIWGPVGKQELYARFKSQIEAEVVLATLPPRTVLFYDLTVVPESTRRAPVGPGFNMVGHPGYDLA